MSYSPAQLESITMDGLRDIFRGSAVTALGEFAPYLLLPFKDIRWYEKPADNAMLRDSMSVVASGNIPTYTGTYIEACVGDDVYSTLVLESTKNILSWMDLHEVIKEHIKTMCPAHLRGQPLKVFFSCTPPEQED